MKINNATPIINTKSPANVPTSSKINFKGTSPKETLKEFLTLNRAGTMGRDLFIANAFVFLLGTRLVTSRDKDERREILIRDIPTIVIAVVGVPVIQDAFAELIQKKTGYAFMEDGPKNGIIASGANKIFNKIFNKDSQKNIISSGQIEDWYQFNNELSAGFKGFTKRLSNGGNLHKIFSSFDDLKGRLKDFSKEDNEKFMEKLFDGSEESNSLVKEFEKAFSTKGNKAFKKASWARTIPSLIGLGLALGLIGLFIPKLNIFITETIHKNRKKETEKKPEKPTKIA